MVQEKQIHDIISDQLDKDDVFIVDLKITSANKISLYLDSDVGVSIDYCVTISKLIEDSLNRDEEDFDLEVSSAGLGQPLKVFRQYKKNIGKEVTVNRKNMKPLTGLLVDVSDKQIVLEVTEKRKVEGKKKKETFVEHININFNDILKTEVVIKFK